MIDKVSIIFNIALSIAILTGDSVHRLDIQVIRTNYNTCECIGFLETDEHSTYRIRSDGRFDTLID